MAAARALAPAPLEALPDSTLRLTFVHHRVVEPLPYEYWEAYLSVGVDHDGEVGNYVPILYLDDALGVTVR